MQSRILAAAGISATALIAATSFAGQASAHNSASSVVHTTAAATHAAAPAKGACYTQDGADSMVGILSTDTDDPAGYSSAGAVDFQVKKSCTIGTVVATGVYAGGSGPADSATVTIYKSKKGLPGKVVNAQTVKSGLETPVLNLSLKKPVKLGKGSYFLSVVTSMDYNVKGGWYWELTSAQNGAVDVWENYGGAFGICPTWTHVVDCQGYGNDFIVTMSK